MQFSAIVSKTRFILEIDACSSPARVKHELGTAVRAWFNLNEVSDNVAGFIFALT